MPKEPDNEAVESRVLRLEEGMKALRGDVSAIREMLTEGAASQKGDRRYVWNVVMGLGTPAMLVSSAILGLYISSKMGPMEKDMATIQSSHNSLHEAANRHEGLLAKVTAENAASIAERLGLLRVQESNVSRVSELEKQFSSEKAVRRSAWVEQETQIHALSESTNAAIADLHRWNYQAAQKIPEMPKYPAGPYIFPNISNRRIPNE